MRYKPEHKDETHRRIVEVASREFREGGFNGIGIAALMKKLNLTHGGFYAHFDGKDGLIAEAISASFDQMDHEIERVMAQSGLPGLIELYLSMAHVDHPGLGCPVPALASEVITQREDLVALFSERLSKRIELLAGEVPGETSTERLELATFMFSAMVGAVTTARASVDPDVRARVLETTKRRLLNLI
jgi:TetR/AcrR family transcriptional repressor of nem operon